MAHKLKTIPVSDKAEYPMQSNWPVRFSVSSKQLPEIKSWKVGGKYRLEIEVEQKSASETEDTLNASFEITKYKDLTEDFDSMTDAELSDYQRKHFG